MGANANQSSSPHGRILAADPDHSEGREGLSGIFDWSNEGEGDEELKSVAAALSGNKLSNNNSGKSGQFLCSSALLHFSVSLLLLLRILMNAIKARTDRRRTTRLGFKPGGRAAHKALMEQKRDSRPPPSTHRPQNKLASCPVGGWVVPEWFLSCEIGDPMDQHDIWGQLDT